MVNNHRTPITENTAQNKTIIHFSLAFYEFSLSACNLTAFHHVRS